MIRAAGQSESDGNVFSYLRDRPLIALGAVATIFLLAFGAYVYIQMNPAMFITQAPRPAATVPIAPAVVAATQSGATTTVPVVPQPVALTSLLPPTDQSAGKDKVAPLSPQLAGSSASAAAATPATAAVTPAVVSAATPALSVPQTPRDTIKVTTGNTAPAINPVLSEAYAALTAGNVEASQRLYNQLLKSDPRNVESLLGLAAIATQQGDRDTATKHYVKILELDPRNAVAQAGLIGMVGRADPQSAETRVKQLIAREPSAAFLYFTLGNTYIDQSRWPDAQQAFFQAHHLQPENPDYAYNLAVALEHMGQPKSALDFYRRAVQLAAARGRANFDVAAAQQRVGKLENAVQ